MRLHSPPQRCLLVSLDNIGDLVFASSVLTRLQQTWPDTQFGVWCKDYARDIGSLLPGSPLIHAADPIWDRAPGRPRGSWLPFLRCMRDIHAVGYPVAVILSRQWRASLATAAAGAGFQQRVGYAGRKSSLWLTQAITRNTTSEPVTRELGRLLAPLIDDTTATPYRLDPTPLGTRIQALTQSRRKRHTMTNYVALHAFAGDTRRCLGLPIWLQLGRRLSARGTPPIWIGSKAEMDQIRAAAAEDYSFDYVDRCSEGTLMDTAAVIAGASLFVGHDSGPLHIASALGIPCLGLFLPGEPLRTFPQGPGASCVLTHPSPSCLSIDEIWQKIARLESSLDD